jgi:hypothetical protein
LTATFNYLDIVAQTFLFHILLFFLLVSTLRLLLQFNHSTLPLAPGHSLHGLLDQLRA